jgi:hypothetical protein
MQDAVKETDPMFHFEVMMLRLEVSGVYENNQIYIHQDQDYKTI